MELRSSSVIGMAWNLRSAYRNGWWVGIVGMRTRGSEADLILESQPPPLILDGSLGESLSGNVK